MAGPPRLRIHASIAHPVRLLPLTFLALILIGTLILLLPFARSGSESPSFMAAFFTATSAVTVTGLNTVDTGEYWSVPGQIIILALVQIGGLGIVALATVLGLFIGGRLGIRTRLVAQAEMHVVNIGEVKPLFTRVGATMLFFESITALVLTLRYREQYFDTWAEAAYNGIFDSIMSFNNAGFSLNSDSLAPYVGDAFVLLPISAAVFFGAFGFPVLAELFRGWRTPGRWTVHTRLTVWGSLVLFVAGIVGFVALERNNGATIGELPWWQQLVTGIESSVMTRSGGLASFDWGEATTETSMLATAMMFIGGGSASTAGGIKITTFLLLFYVILAELRGDADVTIGVRSIGSRVIRTAITIALLSVMLVGSATFIVMVLTDFSFEQVLFECTSAFATAGLSTGITAALPTEAQVVIIVLMFIGRVGTIAAAGAFILRDRTRRYHLPEEQPIIG